MAVEGNVITIAAAGSMTFAFGFRVSISGRLLKDAVEIKAEVKTEVEVKVEVELKIEAVAEVEAGLKVEMVHMLKTSHKD